MYHVVLVDLKGSCECVSKPPVEQRKTQEQVTSCRCAEVWLAAGPRLASTISPGGCRDGLAATWALQESPSKLYLKNTNIVQSEALFGEKGINLNRTGSLNPQVSQIYIEPSIDGMYSRKSEHL